MVFQYCESQISILRDNGGANSSVLELDGEEAVTVFLIWVVLEPVVQVVCADAPTVGHLAAIFNADLLDIGEHHGL